ncbi:RloB domain-containing protein [Oecophyllibacter saccharovorans]|uniref:RloB domain-containing protein n=1 Tax=Oecophyllibacter saccharovorans TaxID=2558360 RepID=UPI00116CF795|nr:RloB domain-containing protein [Oecophyllibacter saccharovorans]TPW35212.1 hypothetical protein E3203_07075 [Oecophyllibacter saccharovorans]
MKRSKRPIRKAKCLVVCEGETEIKLVEMLKRISGSRRGWHLEDAHGGSPDKILKEAVIRFKRIKLNAEISEVFVVLDSEGEWKNEYDEFAKKNHLKLIINVPCSEAEFLRIKGVTFPEGSPPHELKSLIKTRYGKEPPNLWSDFTAADLSSICSCVPRYKSFVNFLCEE